MSKTIIEIEGSIETNFTHDEFMSLFIEWLELQNSTFTGFSKEEE